VFGVANYVSHPAGAFYFRCRPTYLMLGASCVFKISESKFVNWTAQLQRFQQIKYLEIKNENQRSSLI